MATSLSALRDRLDPFLNELGGLHYRFGAGLSPELPLRRLLSGYPEFALPETFLEVREAVDRKSTDDRERPRLALLLEFLAGQVEQTLGADASENLAHFESTASVPMDGGALMLREARSALPRTAQRERRAALERGVFATLWENQAPYAKRLEAALAAARALGFPSYLALRDRVSRYEAAKLLAPCEAVLATTEDAYRDLLGYALKKIDPQLRPGATARWHDLQHALLAPWMLGHFSPGDLLPAVSRWLTDIGFTPNAEGRIQLDVDDRAARPQPPFAAVLKVPDDVRLVVRASGGLTDYAQLLHEYGRAQQAAHVSRNAPVEERRLGDASIGETYGLLFEHLLLDEAWHRRYLRAPQASAKEAARLAAFSDLAALRRFCAQLPYELALYERGVTAAVAEEYEERMSAALFVGVPRANFLVDVAPALYSTRCVRAWALEARLHQLLQQRFNEDFWRNPAAGSWLKNLFSRGQREDADAVAQELTGRPLELREAAARLVRVMGA